MSLYIYILFIFRRHYARQQFKQKESGRLTAKVKEYQKWEIRSIVIAATIN